MDGENNGSKPYFIMGDLGVPLFLETPICMEIIISQAMNFNLESLSFTNQDFREM